MPNKSVQCVESSGNVYQDLGLSNPEERLAKAELATRIDQILRKRRLKQIEAAEILGISQPKVSALMNGRLSGFSMERLIYFLNLLSHDVRIMVTPKSGDWSLGSLYVQMCHRQQARGKQ